MPSKRHSKKKFIARTARAGMAPVERPASAGMSVEQPPAISRAGLTSPAAKAGSQAPWKSGAQTASLATKYSYVPSELKKVGILAVAMFVILIILYFIIK